MLQFLVVIFVVASVIVVDVIAVVKIGELPEGCTLECGAETDLIG